MEWVDRLQEVTGWRQPRWECDWTTTESELDTALPGDYKDLYGRFRPGNFSEYIWVASDRGRYSVLNWYQVHKADFRHFPVGTENSWNPYEPYEPYGVTGQHGLLLWGGSEAGDRFFWLADAAVDPSGWSTVAKDGAQEWRRFDMSISEFVYRVLTEPSFEPFGVPDPNWLPVFERIEVPGLNM